MNLRIKIDFLYHDKISRIILVLKYLMSFLFIQLYLEGTDINAYVILYFDRTNLYDKCKYFNSMRHIRHLFIENRKVNLFNYYSIIS